MADEDLTDNQATATTPVNAPTTDVSIRKIGPSSVTAGTNVSYTIVVGSSGPSDATSVVVSDVTPSGLTFVQNTGDCTTSFPCALGTIPAGQARTITAVFAVPLGYAGPSPILNTATVVSTANDPDSSNNSDSVTTAVNPASADLTITKTGEAAARPGDAISYVLTVANVGPSDALAVVVGDPTPAGLTFVSNSGDCTTPFPCSLGTLTTGQTRTITATFAVDADVGPGTVVNTATVSSPTIDPAPASNTAAFTTEITGSTSGVADLILTKTASHDIVAPGGAITYSVVATNEGPDSAGNVTITDAIPAGAMFVSASPSPGGACSSTRSSSGGSVRCVWLDLTAVDFRAIGHDRRQRPHRRRRRREN